jgi:sugar fermentation stimulation protein A
VLFLSKQLAPFLLWKGKNKDNGLLLQNSKENLAMVSFIEIEGKIVHGIFRERPNRFLALVSVRDKVLPCFVPNPGRMLELLTLGTEVILRKVSKTKRKTSYDLIGVLHNGQTISVDSRVPNKLVFEALKNKDIEEFSQYDTIRKEYSYGHSRFDFLLANKSESCLLEARSCTLVEDDVALFPDALTERGRRHISDLIKARKEGFRACIVFIVQRTDANVFSPNDKTDPKFGKVLREAVAEEVEAYAYCSELNKNRVTLKEKIKMKLDCFRSVTSQLGLKCEKRGKLLA